MANKVIQVKLSAKNHQIIENLQFPQGICTRAAKVNFMLGFLFEDEKTLKKHGIKNRKSA